MARHASLYVARPTQSRRVCCLWPAQQEHCAEFQLVPCCGPQSVCTRDTMLSWVGCWCRGSSGAAKCCVVVRQKAGSAAVGPLVAVLANDSAATRGLTVPSGWWVLLSGQHRGCVLGHIARAGWLPVVAYICSLASTALGGAVAFCPLPSFFDFVGLRTCSCTVLCKVLLHAAWHGLHRYVHATCACHPLKISKRSCQECVTAFPGVFTLSYCAFAAACSF